MDRGHEFEPTSLGVVILDAQQDTPAAFTSDPPDVNRVADVAEMQIAGRSRRETRRNGFPRSHSGNGIPGIRFPECSVANS